MPPAAGAVNVWATELSPLNGEPLPTIADARPPWAVDEVAVLPTVVQPVRPFSKSPLVMPLAAGAVTVRLTEVLCVALVAVPVTVSVYVPGVAVPAPTVRVEPPPVVTEVGLSPADAPPGVPLTVRLIVSAEPLVSAVEMVEIPLWPWTKERLVGFALMEKSFGGGGAVTVNETVVEWVALVPVPVTVTVYVPGVALPAPSVSVELAPAVTDVGSREAVAPDGTPLVLSETV